MKIIGNKNAAEHRTEMNGVVDKISGKCDLTFGHVSSHFGRTSLELICSVSVFTNFIVTEQNTTIVLNKSLMLTHYGVFASMFCTYSLLSLACIWF